MSYHTKILHIFQQRTKQTYGTFFLGICVGSARFSLHRDLTIGVHIEAPGHDCAKLRNLAIAEIHQTGQRFFKVNETVLVLIDLADDFGDYEEEGKKGRRVRTTLNPQNPRSPRVTQATTGEQQTLRLGDILSEVLQPLLDLTGIEFAVRVQVNFLEPGRGVPELEGRERL